MSLALVDIPWSFPRAVEHAMVFAQDWEPRAREHLDDTRVHDEPCPACGFVRWSLPAWARLREDAPVLVFELLGAKWRVLSWGSANGGSPMGMHFYEYVLAVFDEPRMASLLGGPARYRFTALDLGTARLVERRPISSLLEHAPAAASPAAP